MKKVFIVLLVILLIAFGWSFFRENTTDLNNDVEVDDEQVVVEDQSEDEGVEEEEAEDSNVIGTSVEGRAIEKYTYGDGDTEILFVGGIHGGYSWNTSLLAYELIYWLAENEDDLADNLAVTVVPVLNPDGLSKVVDIEGKFDASDVDATSETRVAARFNANNVDLNRNFDCEWQSDAVWQDQPVSGGTSVFSEPEAAALRDYVALHEPGAVVVWYSAAGGVYASNCREGVLAETRTLTNLYADASGYGSFEEFDYYEITGDMVNWLAREEIPAISVLLSNYEDSEWSKNKAGITAVLDHYSN